MSETIRTEMPATITREIQVDKPSVIVEKSDNSLLWIVIAVVVLIGLTQGGGAGCQTQGRGGYGGHGGHGGYHRGPIVKVAP